MGQIRSPRDIKQLGTIMGIWAHPDDETFTSAALMAAAIENGQKVICLTATRGEAGVQDESRWPAQQLADIRSQELEAALKVIGVKYHHWLPYKDGCCWEADTDEAVDCVCDYIEKYQPDTILTFGPDGMTGHPDHQTMCTWATAACRQAQSGAQVYHTVTTPEQYERIKPIDKQFNIYFSITSPRLAAVEDCDIYFEPTPAQRDKKYQALQAMPSQTERMLTAVSKELICSALTPEAFVLSE